MERKGPLGNEKNLAASAEGISVEDRTNQSRRAADANLPDESVFTSQQEEDQAEVSSDDSDLTPEDQQKQERYLRWMKAVNQLRHIEWFFYPSNTGSRVKYLESQTFLYSISLDNDELWEPAINQLELAGKISSQLALRSFDQQKSMSFEESCFLEEHITTAINSAYELVNPLEKAHKYSEEASSSRDLNIAHFWRCASEQARTAASYRSQEIGMRVMQNEQKIGMRVIKKGQAAINCEFLADDLLSVSEHYATLADYSNEAIRTRSLSDPKIDALWEIAMGQTQKALEARLQLSEERKKKLQPPQEFIFLIDVSFAAKSAAQAAIAEIDYLTRTHASSDPATTLYLKSALKITREIRQHYTQTATLFESHNDEQAQELKKMVAAAEIRIIKYKLSAEKLEQHAQLSKKDAPQHEAILADYLEKATRARASENQKFALYIPTLWEIAAEHTRATMSYISQALDASQKEPEEFLHLTDAALNTTSATELVVELIGSLTRASVSSDPTITILWKKTFQKIKVVTDLYSEAAEAQASHNLEEAENLRRQANKASHRAREYASGRATPPTKSAQIAKANRPLSKLADADEVPGASSAQTHSVHEALENVIPSFTRMTTEATQQFAATAESLNKSNMEEITAAVLSEEISSLPQPPTDLLTSEQQEPSKRPQKKIHFSDEDATF